MSLEKCFAVYFPLKSKTVCTVRTAKWLTGIFGIVLGGHDVMFFFLKRAEIDRTSGYMICVVNADFRKVYDFYITFDSFLYSFGPSALMFITNFAIVFKFMGAKCKSDQNNSTESTSQALVKSATRGTAMVVTVSVTFLLLTAPGGVSNALKSLVQLWTIPEYRVFMNITSYLNHSINGFLYCIVGTRFRRELFRLFERRKIPPNVSISSLVTHTVTSEGLYII